MEAKCIYTESKVPHYELEIEKKIHQLFNLSKFEPYKKNELYNYCFKSQDFKDISDYLCTNSKNLRENQHLGLYIPHFMKGIRELDGFDHEDVKYIRDQLMEQIINHEVILPTKNVTDLIQSSK